MKRLFLTLVLALINIGANAQFTNGQVLTAQALNAALAGPNITSGTINGATVGLITPLAGQFTNLTVTGTLTAPVTIGSLVPQAANTVIGNFTGSTASPAANSVPNCFGGAFAITYTLNSGFGCNGAINAAQLGGATFQSPGPIGSVSPSTASFTNLSANGTITLANGSLTLPYLATEAANTIVANATAGVASPTAIAAPSCSTTSSALNWTTNTGLTCNTTINASSLGGTAAASYALLASPVFTGTPSLPTGTTAVTQTAGNSSTALATTAFIATSFAPLASPTFTGTPAAPTAAATTNTTQLATTAMVNSAITGGSLGGSFTTLSATGAVSGAGFTARFATPGPIGNTTASTGAFTTLTASSTITPSSTAGIVGTATNDNANAGSIGELLSNDTLTTSMSSGVGMNATSVSLTAGDWDVTGIVQFNPAGTTTSNQWVVGISTTSATFGTVLGGIPNYMLMNGISASAGSGQQFVAPVTRVSLASTTTVYLVAQAQFSVSTMTVSGFIRARRVR